MPFAQPRPPVATGRVISLNTIASAKGDRPWWVSLVYVLALLPALMAVAVVIAIRAFAKSLRSSTRSVSRSPFKLPALAPKPHWSPSPALTFGAVGVLLGYRAGRASASTEYSQMRVRSTGGETECRYLAAPASIPVVQGDELNLWGSLGRDGVLRGYRLENVSNGATHKVALVPPWVGGAAAISALLCLIVLATVI